ncbi:hypothetical protein WCLP8_240005 [uncultured Gammaproteobacteria bacterium]
MLRRNSPAESARRNRYVVRFRQAGAGLEREELWPVRFAPLLPDLPTLVLVVKTDSGQDS